MNKIFRIIWSAVKDKWIVVSEKSSAKGAYMFTVGAIMSLAAFIATASPAMALDPGALPTGGQVAAGSATITTSGIQMTVDQATQQLIANWNTFNIGQDASVNFVQPNSTSIALNRISDQNPSQILGTLTANGNLMLVNRAGVMFGKTATVNVGGLIASSLDISDSDFLAGNYRFTNAGTAGAVVNEGSITANGGVVAMIAPQVANNGTISASSGSVAMMAGDQVSVQFLGDGMISYTVDKGTIDALAANNSLIQADGGMVVMTAKAADVLTRSVVNQTGIVRATGMKADGGRIILDADGGQANVSGTLDASSANGNGGTIVVTGDQVQMQSGANITASGATGGGEVLVGGGYQGNNPDVRNAQNLVVESGSSITADATDNGDGGTVVLWSELATAFAGGISAEGGPNGGDGGFAEVSSRQNLNITGQVSLLAPKGSVGTILLDPHSIAIVDSGVSSLADDYSKITNTYLTDTLLGGGNVDLSATNDINFLADLTYTGPNGRILKLYAPTIALTGDGTDFSIDSSTRTLNLVFGNSSSQNTVLFADAEISTLGEVTFNGDVGSVLNGNHSLTIDAAHTYFNNGSIGNFSGTYWNGGVNTESELHEFQFKFAGSNGHLIEIDFVNHTVADIDPNTGTLQYIHNDFPLGPATFENGDYIVLSFHNTGGDLVLNDTAGVPIAEAGNYIPNDGSKSRIDFESTVTVGSIVYRITNQNEEAVTGTWIANYPVNVDYTASPLANLEVTGDTTIRQNITTTGNQTYHNNVAIGTNSVLTATDVMMDSASSGVDLANHNLTVNITGTASHIDGVISTAGSLIKDGTGTLTLTGNNTYSGTTTINAGTLQVGNGGTTGTLGTGNVTDNSHLVFDRSNASSYAGVISGTGDVTKNGAGTLTLTGNNTYSGPTAINAGTLQVGNGGTSGTLGTGLVTDNANLLFYRSDAVNLSTLAGGGIVGTGDVTADIGLNFTVDRNIAMTGSGSEVTLASRGGNVTIDGTHTISTSPTGTITVYSGTPDTANLFARMSGATTGGTKYKTYGVTYGVGSQTIHTGTYNFFYRSTPTVTVILTDTKTYDTTNAIDTNTLNGNITGTVDGDGVLFAANNFTYENLVTSPVTFNSVHVGTGIPLNFSVTAPQSIDVGDWSISGYDVQKSGSGTINPATVTYVGGTTTKTYNGTEQTADNTYALSGVYAGDVGNVTLSASVDAHGTHVNTYDDTVGSLSGSAAGDYTLGTGTAGTLVIDPATVTLHGSRVYDATTVFAGSVFGTVNTGINGETLTVSGSGSVPSPHVTVVPQTLNVGSLALVSVSGSGQAGDYQIAETGNTGIITPAPLTVNGLHNVLPYNGSEQENWGATLSGRKGDDSFTISGYARATNVSDGKVPDDLELTAGAGTELTDYSITYNNGSLKIIPAELNVLGVNGVHHTLPYNGTEQENWGATLSGVLGDDSFTISGYARATHVSDGTVPDDLSLTAGAGTDINNYYVNINNGSLTITPAALIVNGLHHTLPYNGMEQENWGATLSGLYSPDSFTIDGYARATHVSDGTVPDNLTVTPGAGTELSDYSITYNNGSLTITPIALTLNGADHTLPYNGTEQENWGATLSGLQDDDSFTIGGYARATHVSDGTVSDNLYVTGLGLTETDDYYLVINNGSLTITPADLTVNGLHNTLPYNGYEQENWGATLSGVQDDDSFTIDGYARATNVSDGTVPDDLELTAGAGTELTDYSITYNNGSLKIIPAGLHVLGVNGLHNTLPYNGYEQENWGATLSGVLGNDSFTISGYARATHVSDGTVPDNLTLTAGAGTDINNYYLSINNGSLTITPAALMTVNGAHHTLSYNGYEQENWGATLSGVLGNDSFTISGYAKATHVSDGTVSDNLAVTGVGSTELSDYTITYNNGSLTITPTTLMTVTGANNSMTYNGTAQTNSGASYSGAQGSDSFTISGYAKATHVGEGPVPDNLYVTGVGSTELSDYDINFINGSLSITPAALTITANDDSRPYDAAVAYYGGNGVTYIGFVNGEDSSVLGGVLGYQGNSQGAINAGKYAIIPAGLSSTDYDISYREGVLTIEEGLVNPADVVELVPPGPVILPEDVIGGKGSNPLVNTTGMDFGSFAELATGSAAELIAAGEGTGTGTPFEQGGEVRTVAMTNEGEVAPSEITTGTAAEQTHSQVIVKLVRNAEAGKPGLVDVLIPAEMIRSGSGITFELPKEVKAALLKGNGRESVKLANGHALPAWMTYNSGNKSFTAINPSSNAFPLKVLITDSSMRSWVVDVMVR